MLPIRETILALMAKGLTQKEIADELECSQPNVSYLANNDAKRPTGDFEKRLRRLARKHGVVAAKKRREVRSHKEERTPTR